MEMKLGWSLRIQLQAALPHSQALQLQRRTKVMAKCISPSAGHSSSTNVLIVGAGWCWINEGKGKLGGCERPWLWSMVLRSCCSGAAGLVCAETLRQEGFSDRIVLCTLDRHLPYDRAKLSKVGMKWGTWILIPQIPVPRSLSHPHGTLPGTHWRSS